ncbi:hypothetical protein CLUG_05173 [Clavispora lusitaniae ATCC 42720]|uniref:Uncharacterized protein n=1 Tax=Clavispora lusitaniae (strain ATCC 42720) TaxID=306902 RepID=C4Y9V2_CLAL4|nr:uncharacterized protein CLUG_05173 [Clavispora lusitaniae ATCC 42720]EEQ41046.1 hypothetical protein CLUG_05173 [Clavispora lusitaniae ATCC 42720]
MIVQDRFESFSNSMQIQNDNVRISVAVQLHSLYVWQQRLMYVLYEYALQLVGVWQNISVAHSHVVELAQLDTLGAVGRDLDLSWELEGLLQSNRQLGSLERSRQRRSRDGLDSLLGVFDASSNRSSVTRHRNDEQAGVLVLVQLGVGAWDLGQRRVNTSQNRSADSGRQDFVLGKVSLGHRNSNGCERLTSGSDAGLLAGEGLDWHSRSGRSRQVREGGFGHKTSQVSLVDARSHERHVAGRVRVCSKLCHVLVRHRGSWVIVQGVSQALSEGKRVESLEANKGVAGGGRCSLGLGHRHNHLGELVWAELGLGNGVGQSFHVVRQVLLQELGVQHNGVTRHVRRESATQELRLSGETQGRLGFGVEKGKLGQQVSHTAFAGLGAGVVDHKGDGRETSGRVSSDQFHGSRAVRTGGNTRQHGGE